MSNFESIAERVKRRRIRGEYKDNICMSQFDKCASCNEHLETTVEIDHIIPLGCGGGNERKNLHALCPNCHARKSRNEPAIKKMIEQWKETSFTQTFIYCWACGDIYSCFFPKHQCKKGLWFREKKFI